MDKQVGTIDYEIILYSFNCVKQGVTPNCSLENLLELQSKLRSKLVTSSSDNNADNNDNNNIEKDKKYLKLIDYTIYNLLKKEGKN